MGAPCYKEAEQRSSARKEKTEEERSGLLAVTAPGRKRGKKEQKALEEDCTLRIRNEDDGKAPADDDN